MSALPIGIHLEENLYPIKANEAYKLQADCAKLAAQSRCTVRYHTLQPTNAASEYKLQAD